MSATLEHQFFTKITQFPVVICQKCQYAISPAQIQRHLSGRRHRLRRADACQVQEAILQWDAIEEDPDLIDVPYQLDEPIRPLLLYQDGLLCRRDQLRCHFVARTWLSMKQHWREKHGWRTQAHRGHPTTLQQAQTKQDLAQSAHHVSCQRLFVQGPNSHYIHIQFPEPHMAHASMPLDQNSRVAQLIQQVEDQFQVQQQQRQHQIEAGQLDEANPWLRRTQWAAFLTGINPWQLLTSIEEPDEESNHPDEIRARAIWEAMEGLIQTSQSCVCQLGHLLRVEAIRTEKIQNRHRPLQAYMHPDLIIKHMRPWQQMMMFLVRTQVEHDWESPGYRFTPRQQHTWQILWQRTADLGAMAGGAAEENGRQPVAPMAILSPLQAACLDFCIELLNQSVEQHEYDSAMICALAVLGRQADGWSGPEDYPNLLSRVIKISRFLVVLKAIRLDPRMAEFSVPFSQRRGQQREVLPVVSPMEAKDYVYTGSQESQSYSDSEANTPISPQPSIAPLSSPPASPASSLASSDGQPLWSHYTPVRSFREWLVLLMDSFMVRGTHSPMQWMLDLRSYGLKIFYNTTAPGHVGWHGADELLYQGLQFTLGDFRGFIHGLVGAAKQLLHNELLFHERLAIPAIPWASLRDDPTQTKAAWSFLHDQRTQWPVVGSQWLMQQLQAEPFLQQRFLRLGSTLRFHGASVEAYLRRVVHFREKLAILVHLTAGQPARGPELLSIRHGNTPAGGIRNLFVEDGLVTFVTRYHKGYMVSGDIKIIHRYVPREVGELVVWYLWLVLPFVERLQAVVHPPTEIEPAPIEPAQERAAYLWPPDPAGRAWNSERLREVLKRESRVGLHGQALNLAAYRNIAIGISRRFLRPSSMFPNNAQEGEPPDAIDEEDGALGDDPEQWLGQIADLQAGHSSHVAGMVYARGIMEQSGAILERRQQFRVSSTDWHQFLGFESSQASASVLGKRKRAPFEVDAQERQTERRVLLLETNLEETLPQMMGQDDWQFRGVQKPAVQAICQGESPVVAVMPTGGGKSLLFMFPAWVAPGGLTVVVVPLISLRGDLLQRCGQLGLSCIEWETRRPPDEAAIVLVTPESALTKDFITFLNRQRLLYRLDRIVIDECHIVLNEQTDFRPAMQQLGKLAQAKVQMVLLTATLPPNQEHRLWERMNFPPASVCLFRDRTTRRNVAYRVWRPLIERASNAGPQPWVQSPAVVAWIQDRIRHARPGKVIIYVPMIRHARLMAEVLGCGAYFHDQVDKDQLMQQFRQGAPSVIVATGALGMGIDIPDIRCILHLGRPRTLLDYGQESGRAGRDGQASEAMIILPEPEPPLPWDPEKAPPVADQALVQRYLHVESDSDGMPCRRVVLDGYLDQEAEGYCRQYCGDEDAPGRLPEARCDGCEPDWAVNEAMGQGTASEPSCRSDSVPVTDAGGPWSQDCADSGSQSESVADDAGVPRTILPATRQMFQEQDLRRAQLAHAVGQRQQRELVGEELLEGEMARWNKLCFLCHEAGRPSDHELYHCSKVESQVAQEWLQCERQHRIQYQRYSGCFVCGLPQSICMRFQDNGRHGWEASGKECQFRGTLLAIMAGMLHGKHQARVQVAWKQWLGEHGVNQEEWEAVAKFLGQKVPAAQVEQNYLVAAFLWLYQLYQEIQGLFGLE
jgi:hypothetical protein